MNTGTLLTLLTFGVLFLSGCSQPASTNAQDNSLSVVDVVKRKVVGEKVTRTIKVGEGSGGITFRSARQ